MKEKKNVIPMGGEGTQVKPSYEELEKKFMSLVQEYNKVCQQAQQMAQELQKMNMFNTFKRLDYLFKVVELKDNFHPEFVSKCVEEIETLLTLNEEPNEDSEETK